MKKICILCILIFGLITSVVFAEDNNIDNSRWFWIGSDSEQSIYIDKQNIKYDVSNDSCDVWICSIFPKKKQYSMCHFVVHYGNNTISSYEYIIYEKGKSEPVYRNNSNGITNNISPASIGELVKNKTLTLINRDEELAAYKKQQEEEAKQAEQERKDEEKEQRNKEIANTAIGIIGGLF